ncbi:MAG TPA: hypothetical protein VIQ30_23470 [Pseudonocardia sp.]
MPTTTAYRIEQRRILDGRPCVERTYALDPISLRPLTAESGHDLLARMVHDHPERYGPHTCCRLVLVCPDPHRELAASMLSPHRWGWFR